MTDGDGNDMQYWKDLGIKEGIMQERKRIIERLSKCDVFNSHVSFALTRLEEEDAVVEDKNG